MKSMNGILIINRLPCPVKVSATLAVFSGMLIAKDKTSSFMLRLFTSPLTSSHFIFGYTLPLFPMAVLQIAVCFTVAFILGLAFNINALLTIVVLIPAAVLFIAIGLLCGALLTNLTAWLSDIWFDLDLVGGAFKSIAEALPFVHAVEAGRAALAGDYSAIFPDLWWVICYAAVIMAIAILVFTNKMNSDTT
ncbi:ABC transporter permease [Desulfitobacterium sp. LBE]|nr:ABC transporter permease [Desulfitobacterium sp. LBE]